MTELYGLLWLFVVECIVSLISEVFEQYNHIGKTTFMINKVLYLWSDYSKIDIIMSNFYTGK